MRQYRHLYSNHRPAYWHLLVPVQAGERTVYVMW
jgi:hypothetical protein